MRRWHPSRAAARAKPRGPTRGAARLPTIPRMPWRASLGRAVHAHGVEMRNDLVDVHDVDVLVMQVEQIDLMGELGAVEGAFLDQRDMEAGGIAVHRARAHAAGGALAADDQALDAEQREMREQRRALEDAGALLGDDDVFRLRGEFVIDGVAVGRDVERLPGGARSL